MLLSSYLRMPMRSNRMNKKYIVHLTPDQRATLEQLTRTGTATVAVQRHARIVCKADGGPDGPAWADASCGSSIGRLAHMAARGRLGP